MTICTVCGTAYSQVVPQPDEISRAYSMAYREQGLFQEHREEVSRMERDLALGRFVKVGWERKRFFKRCTPNSGDRLLDIGCGTGLFLLGASQMNWSVQGVEVSQEAAELGCAVHKLPVSVGRVEDLQLPQDHFAVVTAWEVFEHIAEPRDLLRMISELLQPGGMFVGSVPNYQRYRHGALELGPCSCPPIHLNHWTREALQYTLRHAGFIDVEVSYPHVSIDLLRPLGKPRLRKVIRFLKVALGIDVVTSMFFACRKAL